MAEPMEAQMEALTAEPTEARTVGRVDALAEPIRLTSQG
jgi:hypothetical protein